MSTICRLDYMVDLCGAGLLELVPENCRNNMVDFILEIVSFPLTTTLTRIKKLYLVCLYH